MPWLQDHSEGELKLKAYTCICGFETDSERKAKAHRMANPTHSYRIWVSDDLQYEFTPIGRSG